MHDASPSVSSRDPRTLDVISQLADCHIIPRHFGVSNLTVRLDGDVDSKIGGWCDGQLKRYLDTLTFQPVDGQLVVAGSKSKLRGRFDPKSATFRARLRCDPAQFKRAINDRDGELDVEAFHGVVVDTFAAHASILHSAFLLHYYLGQVDTFSAPFDWVRSILGRALTKALTADDGTLLQDRIGLQVGIPSQRITTPIATLEALRLHYQPDCDLGDGLLGDFPGKSFEDRGTHWLVTLPYAPSLRAHVTFPKQESEVACNG